MFSQCPKRERPGTGRLDRALLRIKVGRLRRVLAPYQHCFGKSSNTIPNEKSQASALRGRLEECCGDHACK